MGGSIRRDFAWHVSVCSLAAATHGSSGVLPERVVHCKSQVANAIPGETMAELQHATIKRSTQREVIHYQLMKDPHRHPTAAT
eukprot:48636-Alexandrium_andersonii.AAC.3